MHEKMSKGLAHGHVATPCHLVIVNANPTHSAVVVVYRSRTTELARTTNVLTGRNVSKWLPSKQAAAVAREAATRPSTLQQHAQLASGSHMDETTSRRYRQTHPFLRTTIRS